MGPARPVWKNLWRAAWVFCADRESGVEWSAVLFAGELTGVTGVKEVTGVAEVKEVTGVAGDTELTSAAL